MAQWGFVKVIAIEKNCTMITSNKIYYHPATSIFLSVVDYSQEFSYAKHALVHQIHWWIYTYKPEKVVFYFIFVKNTNGSLSSML
jgi:hypothetical protein